MIYYFDDELGFDPTVDDIFHSIKDHFKSFGVQITGKTATEILTDDGKIDKYRLFREPPDIVIIDMIQHADKIKPDIGRRFGFYLIDEINEMNLENPPYLIILSQDFIIYDEFKERMKVKNVSYFVFKIGLSNQSKMKRFLNNLEELLRKKGVIK